MEPTVLPGASGVFAVEVAEQGDCRVRGGVRVVPPPDEMDGHGSGVARRAVGDAVAAVLRGGGPRGDTDATAGGDGGEPVVDVVRVLHGGARAFGPRVQGGGAGTPVHHQGARGDLAQADAAALGPRVVRGEGEAAGFVADEGVGVAVGVDGRTQDGQVAQPLTLYTAIDRIGLGLAVTPEFLGPLCVALAGSRRRTDLLCALAAAAAVVTLTRPRPSTDYYGIGLALLAAVCWGCYILLNRTIGERLTGLRGSASAGAVSGLLFLPVGATVLWLRPPTTGDCCVRWPRECLSSAVPFLCDLLALRRVPANFFGIFMSVDPVFAALVGLLVLDQHLAPVSWPAIAVIVTANAVAVGASAAGPRGGEPDVRPMSPSG